VGVCVVIAFVDFNGAEVEKDMFRLLLRAYVYDLMCNTLLGSTRTETRHA
jgi:hypothetical protein